MALNIPVDQVSVRGVRNATIAGSSIKPMSFNYQPQFIQKRVESFDNEGYRLPGIPVTMAKDPKVTVGYGTVNGGLVGLASADPDSYYVANVQFALTDGGNMTFTASDMVIDGSGMSIDPLSDSLQITFIITNPGSVSLS